MRLRREGYCLAFELRKGKQHCPKNTPELLRAICPTKRIWLLLILAITDSRSTIAKMSPRSLQAPLEGRLQHFTALALLGPRQFTDVKSKTTACRVEELPPPDTRGSNEFVSVEW